MSESRVCPSCAQVNGQDARFCGRCGTPLAAAAPVVAPVQPVAPRPADANRTMLGALMDSNAAAPPEPTAPAARPQYRTVVGGGFDATAQAALAHIAAMQQAEGAAKPPPASSTLGLSKSPMSTPGYAVPDEIAHDTIATPAIVAAPIAAPVAPIAVTLAPAPAAAAPVEQARPPREMMRTMLGVGLGALPGAPPSAAQPAVQQPVQTAIVAPAASPASPMSTMVAPVAPPADAPPSGSFGDTVIDPPPASPPAPARAMHRTMVGMAAPQIAPIAQAPAAAPAVSAPITPVAPAAPETAAAPKRNLGPSNRTMLGVAAPAAAAVAAAVAAAEQRASAAPSPTPNAYAPSATTTGDMSLAGLPSPRRRARGWFFALLALGVLLVASVIGAAVFYRVTRSRVDVVAAVVASGGGEVLGVDVARAPEGTRARFGTTETPLTGTHVDFPLAADALRVGDNPVAIDIRFADGTSESHTVTLTVEYRVRADLATLSATPPAITVVVDAIPGSTVVLDAQPLTIDATGHGTRAYALSAITPDASGTVSLTAHYTITPPAPAAAASGTLSSRVPSTTLRLERPADAATTDEDSVTVSGVAQAGASVTVEGAAATVGADGHFSVDAPLGAVGSHALHVVAMVTGRAPATAVIHVERVADLARAAAAYPVDRTITYARLTTEGTANLQGQHVAIEGRVYNVDLQDGHGVLQMLVRDCPASERCPLWVTHSAVTDVTVESWVRVIGTVAPDQHFMSQSGQVRTVPRVDAAFVLPSHP